MSKTVKGGMTYVGDCGGDTGNSDLNSYEGICERSDLAETVCWRSEEEFCRERSIAPACPSGHGCNQSGLG